jgi:uncharacterized protein (DUF1697 family)
MTTRYVALLRGVNVAGANKVKMDDLRAVFTGLGHAEPKTYLQSGNVVFGSAGRDPAALSAGIERALAGELGLKVSVLLRDLPELGKVLAANPYLGQEEDQTKLLVTFLAHAPAAGHVARLRVPAGETAVFTLIDREAYLHCPAGYGRTKLSNAFIEAKLNVRATTRNWKSVTALHGLLSG